MCAVCRLHTYILNVVVSVCMHRIYSEVGGFSAGCCMNSKGFFYSISARNPCQRFDQNALVIFALIKLSARF